MRKKTQHRFGISILMRVTEWRIKGKARWRKDFSEPRTVLLWRGGLILSNKQKAWLLSIFQGYFIHQITSPA